MIVERFCSGKPALCYTWERFAWTYWCRTWMAQFFSLTKLVCEKHGYFSSESMKKSPFGLFRSREKNFKSRPVKTAAYGCRFISIRVGRFQISIDWMKQVFLLAKAFLGSLLVANC